MRLQLIVVAYVLATIIIVLSVLDLVYYLHYYSLHAAYPPIAY